MNNLEEFYSRLYGLSYITRYSIVPRIKDESVAEHSFYVASIVIKLHETYSFQLDKAVTMAIIHDWTEAWTDDITIATKRQFPEIAKAVKDAESEVANKNFSHIVRSRLHEYSNCFTLESLIVHMADVIQCIQYAKHEIKLGNNGYMDSVLFDAESRLEKLKGELNGHER